eukprot:3335175-Rhodomonas_salina.3
MWFLVVEFGVQAEWAALLYAPTHLGEGSGQYCSGDATVLVGLGLGYWDAEWSNSVGKLRTSRGKVHGSSSCAAHWQEALYLGHLLRDLCGEQVPPPVIFEDHQACISMLQHPTHSARCRHVDRSDIFISNQVEKANVALQYKKNDDMTADTMAKALPRGAHQQHTRTLMGMQ